MRLLNMTKLSSLTSISPLDGRYKEKLEDVSLAFSEANLMLTRLTVEINWLETLAKETTIKEIKPLKGKNLKYIQDIVTKFEAKDINHIKELERSTNHDIKAVEYFLKEKITANKNLKSYKEFVHFGCTSDDINNLSYAIILNKTRDEVLLPMMENIFLLLKKMAENHSNIPMLARTHGQPASPTTLGKELANFAYRLNRQTDYLYINPILGKFNGAVGNFNAHVLAYPKTNWQKVCQKFVGSFNLTWNPYTTQIEPHDSIAEYCDILARFNTVMIDACRDIWNYISIGYFKQKSKAKEVGSSTMPHKINPIDFENAEGNLGIANSLLNHFSSKLPISRMQRDLTDSTVMRNLGVAIGHSMLAYKSFEKGLTKLVADKITIKKDLNEHWEILGEAVQTVMRKHGIENPYEKMKDLTRGQKFDKKTLHSFIKKLKIPKTEKEKLLKLTPENYIGKAIDLAKNV